MSERILLATSDPEISRALIEAVDEEGTLVVAPTFRICLAEVRNSAFHLILIDTELDSGDGHSLGPVLRLLQPASKRVLLAHHSKWALGEAAATLGFLSVIDRKLPALDILKKSRLTKDRNSIVENSVLNNLSLREREILSSLAQGLQNNEIAEMYKISHSTIKSHVTSIYRKLGVRNRVEATALLRS